MINIPYHKMTAKVVVYSVENSRDEDKRPITILRENFKTRGKLVSKSGSEKESGDGNSHTTMKTLYIRYRRDKVITRSMRISVNNIEYEILDINDVDDEHIIWGISLKKVEV